jgi:uncharacterized lipoprotein YajG
LTLPKRVVAPSVFAAVVVLAGCAAQKATMTRTATVTRTVQETHVVTVVEQVATPPNAVFSLR